MCIAGSTGSGKTEWLMRFLNNLPQLVEPQITHVLYCYGELNEKIVRLPQLSVKSPHGNLVHIQTYNGVADEDFIKEMAHRSGRRMLMVLDDLAVGIKSQFLDVLFTRGSHNWGVSVIMVTQHLFTKEIRTARVNSHYLVLINSPGAALQVKNLASHLFAAQTRFFTEAYADATRGKFGYLLIDLHPGTEEDERLKTNIYPGEHTIFYKPKEGKNF